MDSLHDNILLPVTYDDLVLMAQNINPASGRTLRGEFEEVLKARVEDALSDFDANFESIMKEAFPEEFKDEILYNGRHVFDVDEFNYDRARVGDLVTEAVVQAAMDVLPPVCMTRNCMQIGEPADHVFDNEVGRYRAVYTTFKAVDGHYPNRIWKYCGFCFAGENVER